MSQSHPSRHALLARITEPFQGKGRTEAHIFYAEIFKTTETNFWYHGKYSKQPADRRTHRVQYFDSMNKALAELEAIQARAGLAEKQRTMRESKEAAENFKAGLAIAVTGWKEGTEDD